jgi:uncharacterized protein (DUF2236 family)
VSWTVHREVVLLLGWGRAILLQCAHPLVAQGIADHSTFAHGPFGRFGRLRRTLDAMLALTYGSPDEVALAVSRINARHATVTGVVPAAHGSPEGARPYRATDPALLQWVHATTVQSFLLAYELYVGPLSRAERDGYCDEAARGAAPLGIPAGSRPLSFDAVEACVQAMLNGGALRVGEVARRLAREVLASPLSGIGAPLSWIMRLSTVGLLPEPIRLGYGFAWQERHEWALRAMGRTVRATLPFVPGRLRYWRRARLALGRAARPASEVTGAAGRG